MIRLKSIKLKNFASFAGEHFLEFPKKGLYALSGSYASTPGRSNGAGKTSLLRAIAYVLDYADLSSEQLQNWDTDEPYAVDLELDFDDEIIAIHRTKLVYTATYKGALYKAGNAKEFLTKTLLSPKLISFITYRAQDISGNFLQLDSGEKLEFLIKLLELDKFERFIEDSEKKLKFIQSEIERLDKEDDLTRVTTLNLKERLDFFENQKIQLESAISVLENELKNITEPVASSFYNEEDLEKIKAKKQKLNDTVFVGNTQELTTIDENIKILSKGLVLKNIRDEKKALQEQATQNSVLEDRVRSAIKQRQGLTVRVQEVKTATVTCPSCDSVFSPGHQLGELARVQRQLSDVERSIDENQKAIAANFGGTDKLENIAKIEQLLDLKQRRIAKSEEDARVFSIKKQSEIEKLEQEIAYFKKACLDRLEEAKQRFYIREKQLNDEITNKQSSAHELVIKIADLQAKYNLRLNEISENKEKRTFYRDQRDFYLEAVNAVGRENFTRLVTEESLDLVTALTNDYLSKIPNTSAITIKFVTEKETKKGAIKRAINLQVFSDGMERPYVSLSGGEKCSLNLTIDAAISQIISERTGRAFGWNCIDEGLDGMDATTKKESLQVLKMLAAEKLILIVEHSAIVSDSLDGNILISKTHEGSTFETPPNKNSFV